MRRTIVRSAVLAASLALAAACTGEHSTTIGPPQSTAPSTGDAASPASGLADAAGDGSAGAEATGSAAAGNGAADKGAADKGAGGKGSGGKGASETGARGTGASETGARGTAARGTAARGTAARGTAARGTAARGTAAAGGQRPASIGPGADIPASVMLKPTDFPAGRALPDQTSPLALPPTEPAACQPRTAFPSDRYRYGARTREIESGQPESGFVFEAAVRYSAGRAAQAMTEMRRVLAACHSYPEPEASATTVSHRLERERFAGDDALLVLRSVRSPTPQPTSEYITVVRLGDVLLTTTSTGSEATVSLSLALRPADVGTRRGACLRSTC